MYLAKRPRALGGSQRRHLQQVPGSPICSRKKAVRAPLKEQAMVIVSLVFQSNSNKHVCELLE